MCITFKCPVCTVQQKTSFLTLHGEIVAVCHEILTTHRNTLCGKNIGLLNVETVGTEFNNRALKF